MQNCLTHLTLYTDVKFILTRSIVIENANVTVDIGVLVHSDMEVWNGLIISSHTWLGMLLLIYAGITVSMC